MEKRDYIEAMIEQMGLFLRTLLADLIKNIGTESSDESINYIEEKFSNEFKISMDEFVKLPETEFKNFCINQKFRETHLEDLAELFFQLSLKNSKKSKFLKEKAIQLLDLADLVSNSYSVERITKKNKIQNS